MSCTFWIRRKRLAAEKAAAEAKKVTEAQTAETEEKAVTANDKRTGRKSKAGDSSD